MLLCKDAPASLLEAKVMTRCLIASFVVNCSDTLLAVSVLVMTLMPAELQQSLVHLCMHICLGL